MTTKLRLVFGASSHRLLRDARGVTLAVVALALTALIGFAGLGVETGLWYAIKRQNQSAADVAALSGALELYTWQAQGQTAAATYPDICGFAQREATRNGFTFQSYSCPTSTPACTNPSSGQMCANNPPATAGTPNFGNANAVEVILAQQQNALFASIPGISLANVTINTRAVAAILASDKACVVALGSTGTDITLQGNPSICLGTITGGACGAPGTCSIAAASSSASAVSLGGSSSLIASAVVTPGGCSGCGSVPVVNAPVSDPYATKLTHTFLTTGMPTSGTCTLTVSTYTAPTSGCVIASSSLPNTGSYNLSGPMQISGGLAIKNGVVHLSPGTYWITDGNLDLQMGSGATLDCPTCTPGGAGVTIILAAGSGGKVGTLTLGAGANLNLNAPSTGTFAGLAIIQDSNGLPSGTTYTTSPDAVSGQGNPTETLNGLVYFPNATMDFYGTPSGGNNCLVLVAKTVKFYGNPTLNSTGCSSSGLTLPTPIVLAE
jgi:Flp pilus assembly protein TadG